MTTMATRMNDSYFNLVREFPLVPLKDEAHYNAAVSFLEALAVRDEYRLDEGQKAYLGALTQFVGDYEDQRYRIEASHMTPIDMLKHLMAESGMTPMDLGSLLGSRSVASLVLNGKRGLSKTHIAVLSEHFRVDPGLLFEKRGALKRRIGRAAGGGSGTGKFGLTHDQ